MRWPLATWSVQRSSSKKLIGCEQSGDLSKKRGDIRTESFFWPFGRDCSLSFILTRKQLDTWTEMEINKHIYCILCEFAPSGQFLFVYIIHSKLMKSQVIFLNLGNLKIIVTKTVFGTFAKSAEIYIFLIISCCVDLKQQIEFYKYFSDCFSPLNFCC